MTPSSPAGHHPAATLDTSAAKVHGPATGQPSGSTGRLIRLVLLYNAARLAVIAALVAVLIGVDTAFDLGLPQMPSLIGALLLGVALSAVAFRSLRRRINREVIVIDERRRNAP